MRTNRTSLCASCAARLPATDHCPRCGGHDLFDLQRASARRKALAALRRQRLGRAEPIRLGETLSAWYIKYGLVLLTALGAYVGWRWADGSVLTAFVVGLATLWGAVAAFFVAAGAYSLVALVMRAVIGSVLWAVRRMDPERRSGIPWLIASDEQELLPEHGLSELRGTVRVLEPLTSPVQQTPCAAFRLVGHGPLGEIDDAGATPFELETEDGERVRVEPDPAWVALEVEERAQPVQLDDRLRRFLEQRGLFPERGEVRVAEAVLRDGDPVVVEGALETSRGRGAASTGRVKVLREREGAPLVLRRP